MSPRAELNERLDTEFPGWQIQDLAGDASTRRFLRICGPAGETRIVMDYGEPFMGETDDIRLARIFRKAGLPVAGVVASFPDPGFLVLEDLGDRLLEQELLGSSSVPGEEPPRGLLVAVDLAARVARVGTPVLRESDRATGPRLDGARFRFEMDFFLEHFVVAARGFEGPLDRLRATLHTLADRAAETPRPILCHRDFHSRNLLIREDGSPAMVDIQDARWGPDSYDLASLLFDAYVEIAPGWIPPAIERFLGGFGNPPEAESFRRRFDVVAAQRMIKALGTFGFQQTRRRSTRYLSAVTRTENRLADLLPRLEGPAGLMEGLHSVGLFG